MKVKQIVDTQRVIVRSSSTRSMDSHASSELVSNSPRKGQRKSQVVRKRVRFGEEQNVYHTDPLNKEERKALWYSATETMALKTSFQSFAKRIIAGHDKDAWIAALRRAYLGLRNAQGPQDVEDVMEECQNLPNRGTRIGMEKYTVRVLVKDKMQTRKEMWQMAKEKQYKSDEDLRAACRDLSRPSRLFAYHIAILYGR